MEEITHPSEPGKVVIPIEPHQTEDRTLGFNASVRDRDLLTLETNRSAE